MMAQAKSEGRVGDDIMDDERMHDDLHWASRYSSVGLLRIACWRFSRLACRG